MKLLSLTIPGETPVKIQTPPGIPENIKLVVIMRALFEVIMVVGIILSLLYLVYGGIYWIQTKGDKEALDKARRIITYAIVGLIIMSFALVIVNIFTSALGIESIINPR